MQATDPECTVYRSVAYGKTLQFLDIRNHIEREDRIDHLVERDVIWGEKVDLQGLFACAIMEGGKKFGPVHHTSDLRTNKAQILLPVTLLQGYQ